MNVIIQKGRSLGKSISIQSNLSANMIGVFECGEIKDLNVLQYYRAALIGRITKVWVGSWAGNVGISFTESDRPTHVWENNRWRKTDDAFEHWSIRINDE
jgi:hypothetical protein